jgi:hypothetical protein
LKLSLIPRLLQPCINKLDERIYHRANLLCICKHAKQPAKLVQLKIFRSKAPREVPHKHVEDNLVIEPHGADDHHAHALLKLVAVLA